MTASMLSVMLVVTLVIVDTVDLTALDSRSQEGLHMSTPRKLLTIITGAFASLGLSVALIFFLIAVLGTQSWAIVVVIAVLVPTAFPVAILWLLLTTRPRPMQPARLNGTGAVKRNRAWVKRSIPANVPIRATILSVLDEATALKHVIASLGSTQFRQTGTPIGVLPVEYSQRIDEAIASALTLTDRCRLIFPNGQLRQIDPRTQEALEVQQEHMTNLHDALRYSRSTIEVLAISQSTDAIAARKLTRSLNALSDAIGEMQGVNASRMGDEDFTALSGNEPFPTERIVA